MPRPKGSPNADFDASRRGLLARLRAALLGRDPPSSLRALAAAAGVAVPTLRHYFGGREQALTAVFGDCHAGGRAELDAAAAPAGPFAESVRDLLAHVAAGFRHGGLTRLHAVGLAEGLTDADVGRAYLAEVLEPTLRAAQARLEAHAARGETRPFDARHAALHLISPLVVLFLHQDGLGGAAAFPVDVEAFLQQHAAAFVAAHGAD